MVRSSLRDPKLRGISKHNREDERPSSVRCARSISINPMETRWFLVHASGGWRLGSSNPSRRLRFIIRRSRENHVPRWTAVIVARREAGPTRRVIRQSIRGSSRACFLRGPARSCVTQSITRNPPPTRGPQSTTVSESAPVIVVEGVGAFA